MESKYVFTLASLSQSKALEKKSSLDLTHVLMVGRRRTTLLLEKQEISDDPSLSRDGAVESSGKRRGMPAKMFNDRSGKQESTTSNWHFVIPKIQRLSRSR